MCSIVSSHVCIYLLGAYLSNRFVSESFLEKVIHEDEEKSQTLNICLDTQTELFRRMVNGILSDVEYGITNATNPFYSNISTLRVQKDVKKLCMKNYLPSYLK